MAQGKLNGSEDRGARSLYSVTLIFVVLAVLTVVMGLILKGWVTGSM